MCLLFADEGVEAAAADDQEPRVCVFVAQAQEGGESGVQSCSNIRNVAKLLCRFRSVSQQSRVPAARLPQPERTAHPGKPVAAETPQSLDAGGCTPNTSRVDSCSIPAQRSIVLVLLVSERGTATRQWDGNGEEDDVTARNLSYLLRQLLCVQVPFTRY